MYGICVKFIENKKFAITNKNNCSSISLLYYTKRTGNVFRIYLAVLLIKKGNKNVTLYLNVITYYWIIFKQNYAFYETEAIIGLIEIFY